MNQTRTPLIALILGDALAILVVSLIGFITHYGKIEGWRWLTTFLPVLAGWFAIAPWFGVYRPGASRQLSSIWRPALAAFLSAPFAAWLRGAWLNSAILPLFILVMALTNALGFLVWRALWALISSRTQTNG